MARRPDGEGLLEMAEHALSDMAEDWQSPQAKALAHLVHDTPALRGGDHAKYEEIERLMADALAHRTGRQASDAQIRVVAATAAGVLRLATEAWLASDGPEGPEVWGKQAFAALRLAAQT